MTHLFGLNSHVKSLGKALFVATLLAATACLPRTGKEIPVDPDPDPNPSQTAATKKDLVISYLGIRPEHNEGIYEDIVFIEQTGENEYSYHSPADIRYYTTDITRPLKAMFATNAASVKVNGTEQESGVTSNVFSSTVAYRFYAENGEYVERSVRISNPADRTSGMPILSILLNGRAEVNNGTKETWQRGKIWIDRGATLIMERNDSIEVKGRGHLTWSMEKKPYNFRLLNKQSGANMLGMAEHKRWVLLANHADKTLLRNRVAFEIARRVGLVKENKSWTCDSRYVEVFFNGKYLGSYLLTEQIRIDKNRVNIKETDETATGDDITGGYLFEIDRYWDEGHRFKPTRSNLPFMVKDPDPLNAAQKQYVENLIAGIEEQLYPAAPAVPDTLNYHDKIDIGSFIRTMFVYELTDNNDARLPGSLYMHKDVDSKNNKLVSGPVWDFDYTTFEGGSEYMFYGHTASANETNFWYAQLMTDPKFRARAKEMWIALYDSGALSSIPKYIDDQSAPSTFLPKSAATNWTVWEFKDDRNHDKNRTWNEAVTALKTKYTERLNNLNNKIRTTW